MDKTLWMWKTGNAAKPWNMIEGELGLGWNHIERMATKNHGTMVGFYGTLW